MNRAERRQQYFAERFGVKDTADVYMAIKTAGDLGDWDLAVSLAHDHNTKTCIICLDKPIYSDVSDGVLIMKTVDQGNTPWFRCCEKCARLMVQAFAAYREGDPEDVKARGRGKRIHVRSLDRRPVLLQLIQDSDKWKAKDSLSTRLHRVVNTHNGFRGRFHRGSGR